VGAELSNRLGSAFGALTIAVALTAWTPAFAGETAPLPDRVVDALTIADIKQVVEHAGGKVTDVRDTEEGFTVNAEFPDGSMPWFDTMECKGAGKEKRCTEFRLGLTYKTESAARATELQKQFRMNWLTAYTDDDRLILPRMDFTYGGMPIRHLEMMLKVLMDIGHEAERAIWPPEKNKKPDAPKS